ncbi:hypothetical protein BV898_11237 [Hypsibius exemplaris]|uniref:Kazal-like domain-containing protein n=1 Tax=Hypsibius exemplaris TaxID=2072580 RepID=A0A1W0WH39_HYPEX|nr:hypothetical protein BV898_11237 [Hypsibius exemplaris]
MHSAILVVLFCGLLSVGVVPQLILETDQAGCPPESIVNCFVNPCRFARCPNVPAAICHANYCGGCNAQWFLGIRDVTPRCGGLTGISDA